MTPVRPTTLRRITGAPNGRILGIGAYRPARVVPNSELVDRLDSSDEWIRSRSGIQTRRFAGDDESVIDMSAAAAGKALAAAGVSSEQIGCTILATITYPFQTPAAAAVVNDRLGSRAAALDISAACAGFCYGIAAADQARPDYETKAGESSGPTGAGHSVVVDPFGKQLGEAGYGPETLVVEIDPTDADEARKQLPLAAIREHSVMR